MLFCYRPANEINKSFNAHHTGMPLLERWQLIINNLAHFYFLTAEFYSISRLIF